jgi:hypothetical protein
MAAFAVFRFGLSRRLSFIAAKARTPNPRDPSCVIPESACAYPGSSGNIRKDPG